MPIHFVISTTFIYRFISQLLTLLVCPNEQTSLQIRSGVKESLGIDLSPALFKPFFTLVKATKNCFFQDGQVRGYAWGLCWNYIPLSSHQIVFKPFLYSTILYENVFLILPSNNLIFH